MKKLDAFLSLYESRLLELEKELRNRKMPVLTEELFSEFERTGNRLKYEEVYFLRRKMLSVYGLLTVCYEEHRTPENVRRLEEILEDICGETTWALPAHVNRAEDSNWSITLDLFAAETAFSLADIVSRLSGQISEEIYECVKSEVFRRVLTPFINSKDGTFWWEQTSMNWCAVCCGSVGGAAIWFVDDKTVLDQMLARLCKDISNYIDGFSEDGACLEGLGYYTYGMNFYVAFADMLYHYSGGKTDLLADEKIHRIAQVQGKCFLPGNIALKFSDCTKERFRMGLAAYFAMRYSDVDFPDFDMAADFDTDNCYRYVVLSGDVLWAKQYYGKFGDLENKKTVTGGKLFLPEAEWSVYWSQNNCVLAVKGGHNDEPHNHNDVGSFFYVSNGKVLLEDLGAGEYTKDYFGEGRYENLCCRSLGHNVPLIDGMEQKAGTVYRTSLFSEETNGSTIMEIGGAYGLPEGEKIYRTVVFCEETGRSTITDEFSLQEGRRVVENLISCYKPEIVEHGFVLHAEAETWRIRCGNGTAYSVSEETYTDHYGVSQTAWHMQWEVTANQSKISIYSAKDGESRYE